MIGELAQQPDVMALELLRRARNQGYAGGKSALFLAACCQAQLDGTRAPSMFAAA